VIPSLRLSFLGTWLEDDSDHPGTIVDLLNEVSHRSQDTVIPGAELGVYVQYLHVIRGIPPAL